MRISDSIINVFVLLCFYGFAQLLIKINAAAVLSAQYVKLALLFAAPPLCRGLQFSKKENWKSY
jgi:hypothetical protein